jgi:ribonucleoside-triphosphate reductase
MMYRKLKHQKRGECLSEEEILVLKTSLSNSGAITANYWLSEIYDEKIGKAHKNADIHIHDLSMLTGYCAGWSLKQLITEGLGGIEGKITSAPAKHLSVLCNQMVNFLGTMQNEWAGAQAFSSFDTYLP